MFYTKLIFLGIFRQKKYSIALFATMLLLSVTLTAVVGVHTENTVIAEELADSYDVTVSTVFYRRRSQTNDFGTERIYLKEDMTAELLANPAVEKAYYYMRTTAVSLQLLDLGLSAGIV